MIVSTIILVCFRDFYDLDLRPLLGVNGNHLSYHVIFLSLLGENSLWGKALSEYINATFNDIEILFIDKMKLK